MAVAVFLGMLLVFLALVALVLWWAFKSVRRMSVFVWHKVKPDGAGGRLH
jgi:hypothetical protein